MSWETFRHIVGVLIVIGILAATVAVFDRDHADRHAEAAFGTDDTAIAPIRSDSALEG